MKIDLSYRSMNLFIITIILFGFIFACVKSDIQTSPQEPVKNRDIVRIMIAKDWLNRNLPPDIKSGSEWMPLWEYAFTEESKNSQTVEIPIAYLKEQLIVLPECKKKFLQTKEHKYLQNITRLIVETNAETGKTRGYFMSVVPSLNYLEKTKFKPFNNSYLDRDSKFDGCVIFRDLTGRLVNGWMYSDGKIILSMEPYVNSAPLTKPTEYCQTTYEITYTEWTYNNSANVDYSDISISESTSCWILYDYLNYDEFSGGGGNYDAVDNGITYDATSMELIKPAIDKIKQDCAGVELLNSLADYGVKFEYVVGQLNPMAFMPNSKRITWCLEIVTAPQVFHELFHAYQQKKGWTLPKNLNAEIEAYLALYKYSIKNGFDVPGAMNDWINAFKPYVTDPTQNNYQTMANFVKNLGYSHYIDDPALRSTPNVTSIFSCY